MTSTIPSSMRALVTQKGHRVAVEQIPVPTLDDNDVLVEVKAIAQNPTDWKHVADPYMSIPGTIIGCDFSGIVARLGRNTKAKIAIGDHVVGFVQGGYWKDRGAFAEYVKTDSDLVWVVPDGILSHTSASTMGCALYTAIQVLYHPRLLHLVAPPSRVSSEIWFFVYGGSTSVGLYAIQLAHLSGYKVVTVASPHNHGLLKSLGATAVFDYKSPNVIEQIKRVTGEKLHIGIDTHCDLNSQTLSVCAFGPGPGELGVIRPPAREVQRLRPDIALKHTIIYTGLGREYDMAGRLVPASSGDRANIVQFLPKVSTLVKEGRLKPNPVKFWPGGLQSISDGFRYMMAGKVSGAKIVYTVPV